MSFETQIKIAFGETDPAGLVYFPNILHYCHVAMERFFSDCCKVEYSSLIRDENLGFPTVKAEADFLTPIIYGDTVLVEIQPLKIGNSSLQLKYSIRRLTDSVLCARILLVHVAMNLSTKRPTPIPPAIRHNLELVL